MKKLEILFFGLKNKREEILKVQKLKIGMLCKCSNYIFIKYTNEVGCDSFRFVILGKNKLFGKIRENSPFIILEIYINLVKVLYRDKIGFINRSWEENIDEIK